MILFYTLIFPGALFALTIGMVGWWLERKVSALVQHRVGPPWYQNFADVFKLMGKESIVPEKSTRWLYVVSPLAGVTAAIVLAVLIGMPVFLNINFAGDVIVIIYTMALGSTAIFLGAAASSNVYAGIGAGRELKMLLADELVFVMVVLVPVIQRGFTLNLKEIITGTPAVFSISGVIAYVVGLLAIQAKLAIQPFDIAEAETELAGGVEIEYSGVLLALWKMAKGVHFFVFPMLLAVLFFGIPSRLSLARYAWFLLFYVVTLAVLIVIKNVNPRTTIQGVLRFFWKRLSILAFVAIVLAILGV